MIQQLSPRMPMTSESVTVCANPLTWPQNDWLAAPCHVSLPAPSLQKRISALPLLGACLKESPPETLCNDSTGRSPGPWPAASSAPAVTAHHHRPSGLVRSCAAVPVCPSPAPRPCCSPQSTASTGCQRGVASSCATLPPMPPATSELVPVCAPAFQQETPPSSRTHQLGDEARSRAVWGQSLGWCGLMLGKQSPHWTGTTSVCVRWT